MRDLFDKYCSHNVMARVTRPYDAAARAAITVPFPLIHAMRATIRRLFVADPYVLAASRSDVHIGHHDYSSCSSEQAQFHSYLVQPPDFRHTVMEVLGADNYSDLVGPTLYKGRRNECPIGLRDLYNHRSVDPWFDEPSLMARVNLFAA